MMIGKTENTSASYINPTTDAMRASAERVAQAKQDVQKNAAEGLVETNAVYKLDISDEGWGRMEAEKKQRTDEQGNPLMDGKLEKVVDCDKWTTTNEYDWQLYDPVKNAFEVDSLSRNMYTIEQYIGFAFEGAKLNDGGSGLHGALSNLGMALNAYLHKRWNSVTTGRDSYLQGLCDRLDKLDNTNPVLWQVRSLIDETMNGREIDVWSDAFESNAKNTWKAYQLAMGRMSEDEDTNPKDLFNEKTATYCYMQILARWQSERDGDLVEEMTGIGDGERDNHTVGEVLQSTSLKDGLQAIKDHQYRLQKSYYADEDPSSLSEEQLAEEAKTNDKALLYSLGYDWNVICKQYLKENPDVAAVFAAYGDPYKTSWN